jgi:hypothetical protein
VKVTAPARKANESEQVSSWEQWRREASESPPNIDDFAKMMADIRVHAARDRQFFPRLEPPDKLLAALACLQAVLSFLQCQPGLMERQDLAPLLRLNSALNDLTVGKGSELLKPVKRTRGGHPGDGATRDFLKGKAARALSELIEAKENPVESAGRVARALKANRHDMGKVNAETVVNWRERLMQGKGPGASEYAILAFQDPVPGDTPKARGEFLLTALTKRGGAVG